jgi:pantoate--beta-alanine ligase
MLIIKSIKQLDNQIVNAKLAGKLVGFAPTMGALHQGHLSLIRLSKKQNDLTVCSIFVNPTQFNDKKDFEKYPNTIARDIELLIKEKCDILFLPDVKEMYPKGTGNSGKVDFGFLAETLEGDFRPGHFDGMAQIVEKLLDAVKPHNLYMGQKDYQQAMIVSKLINERKFKINLVVCPVKREKSGLAMSSRNVRLSETDLTTAAELYKGLKKIRTAIIRGQVQNTTDAEDLASFIFCNPKEIKVEYCSWRKPKTLKKIKSYSENEQSIILIAAWVGGVRLIDNLLVD